MAAAVVRAVPHTIARTGSSGITPSSLPPIDTGTWWTPSHRLAIAPNAPGHVAIGDQQLQQHDGCDDHQSHYRRAERNPEQIAGLTRADRPVVH